MQSKRVVRLEHQLSENIKITQQRIWSGVTKDVSYLRRIFNEIYMLRFKVNKFKYKTKILKTLNILYDFAFQPVYSEHGDLTIENPLPRSESCPNLEMYHPKSSHHFTRKRAYSENYQAAEENDAAGTGGSVTPNRHSDTDLTKIDKRRTFERVDSNLFNDGSVLARVVQALSTMGTLEEDMNIRNMNGFHGFSDSQILSEEHLTSGSNSPTPPVKPRIRAISDFQTPYQNQWQNSQDYEWTWNGTNAQINELRKMRSKLKDNDQDLLKAAVLQRNMSNGSGSHAINIDDTISSIENQSFLSKINPFKKPSVILDAGFYLDSTAHGRDSRASQHQQYLTATNKGRSNILQLPDSPDISGLRKRRNTFAPTDMADQEPRKTINTNTRRRPSIFEVPNNQDQNLLETTTIADLIRAIGAAHTMEQYPSSMHNNNLMAPLGATRHPVKVQNQSRRPSAFPNDFDMPLFLPPRMSKPSVSGVNSSRRASHCPISYNEFMQNSLHGRRQSLMPGFGKNLAPSDQRSPSPFTSKHSPKPTKSRFNVRPVHNTFLSVPNNVQSSNSSNNPIRRPSRPSPLAEEPFDEFGLAAVASTTTRRRNSNQFGSTRSTKASAWRPSHLLVPPSDVTESNDNNENDNKKY